jgi:hypothetical protein
VRPEPKKVIPILLVLLPLACIAGIGSRVIHVRNKAEEFLRDATALQLRLATQGQVQRLMERSGGHIEPSTCDSKGCAYFVRFENSWLRMLHLAPRTQFTATLGMVDGVLGYRRVFLTSGNTSSEFGAFVQEWLISPKGPEAFHVSGAFVGSGTPYRVFIDLTPDATPEQHRAAYALNLECLSKFGGCENARQLLPSVSWKNITQ